MNVTKPITNLNLTKNNSKISKIDEKANIYKQKVKIFGDICWKLVQISINFFS